MDPESPPGNLAKPEPLPEPSDRAEQAADIRRTSLYIGPLPHPQMLERYEQILPGAADRILKMAEKEQAHRHAIESSDVQADVRETRRGQLYAFIIAMSVIAGSVYLIYTGHDVKGFVAMIATVATLVGLFLYGRMKEHEEEDQEQSKKEASTKANQS